MDGLFSFFFILFNKLFSNFLTKCLINRIFFPDLPFKELFDLMYNIIKCTQKVYCQRKTHMQYAKCICTCWLHQNTKNLFILVIFTTLIYRHKLPSMLLYSLLYSQCSSCSKQHPTPSCSSML